MNVGFKHIVVSEKNYQKLKSLGVMGDSFNDVISSLIGKYEARVKK